MPAVLNLPVTADVLFDLLTEDGYPNVTRSAVALAVRAGVSTPDEYADWEDSQAESATQRLNKGRIFWDE